ncbi:MAG: hypothetical protein JST00_05880 [Deltaproteobacteria bacterium]|nr:hypothetical protein [Deltaproteobacteria bacterium]
MRARSALLLLCTLPIVGCGLVFGLGDYRIDDTLGADGSFGGETGNGESGPPPECTTNAECTDRATKQGPLPGDAGDGGPIGVDDAGVAPAVCVKSVGKCARLLSEDCTQVLGDYKNDDAIVLATLFTLSGATAATNLPRQQSALLAAEEINSSLGGSGIPPAKGTTRQRPLVVVSCDESKNLDRVGKHLVNELRVAGVVGPNTSQDTLDLTTRILSDPSANTVIMSPTGVAAGIAGLADNNLTWRNIPSDIPRGKLMMAQLNAMESGLKANTMPGQVGGARAGSLKLAIVYRDDAQGQSNFGVIAGDLQWNGAGLSAASNASFVTISKYAPANAATEGAAIVADLEAKRPDVIAVFGQAESVTSVLLPYEKALQAAGATRWPYYMLIDSNRTKELIDATVAAGVNPDLRVRLRGVGVTSQPSALPVLNAFNAAYSARYGSNPRVSNMGQSYDGMYALALALAATTDEPPSGKSIAKGLTKLGVGTDVLIGQANVRSAFQKLAAGETVRATGTFSEFKWDNNGDLAGGLVEIWCVSSGTPNFFGSTGLTMDVATLTQSGTFTQCP